MIVKCTYNQLNKVPEEFLSLGPDTIDAQKLALSVGKHYAVYAVRKDGNSNASWYFVYTDQGYLWWMPADAFEIVDSKQPEGWTEHLTPGKDIILSYPSLHEWKIEEGIIDGDDEAERTFLAEAHRDGTFPNVESVNALNDEFERQKRWSQYEERLALAKEKGWEYPEKPEN